MAGTTRWMTREPLRAVRTCRPRRPEIPVIPSLPPARDRRQTGRGRRVMALFFAEGEGAVEAELTHRGRGRPPPLPPR
jgi:hypothetical protein